LLSANLDPGLGIKLTMPARLPYQPFNAGKSEALAVLACTDTNEQKSVVLLPQLDKLHP